MTLIYSHFLYNLLYLYKILNIYTPLSYRCLYQTLAKYLSKNEEIFDNKKSVK